ncbi:Na+/H+ antiporter NhaA [Pleionea litopenaei]|uniref:Na(+)/H(+) antiporter NhaA n=1 Tax=Pleionea litopenaei TaxID=3070815 RepID=A0AA51X6D5_9GAMM|nr:Na+/H+ antiporter NhaA [Pleionea sp. HL-JVS1]WMS86739.1 Na+/H+ antiporter NhaA [Pleionea sp. HL-JVS1]
MHTVVDQFKRFLQLESASGIILLFAAVLALIASNTGLNNFYQQLIDVPVAISVGSFAIAKPLLLWINDGLMALFFLLVGLELKREFYEGELSEASKIVMPGLGAIGGMIAPAAIYAYINWDSSIALQGWAIPAATDIAFALGILMLLGNRVPTSLKVFLVTLAIFDDIGAIIIIALFYTANLSLTALFTAIACMMVLFAFNRRRIYDLTPYLLVGLVMWTALLKSGVHATLAGVLLAMFIPMRDAKNPERSPVKSLEHDLHGMVAMVVLPIFAFANAGVPFLHLTMEQAVHPVPFGIFLGLVVGKPVGIMVMCGLGVLLKIAKLPEGASWVNLLGVSFLCGIGFTMSLFIGSLAFQETGVNQLLDERLGILVGSIVSGILGILVLKFSLKKSKVASS